MPRYYTEIDKDTFIKKVEDLIVWTEEKEDSGIEMFPWEMSTKLMSDFKKIQFDWENYTIAQEHQEPYANYPFLGHKELKPGFHVYFMQAGGDWEFPICFILYWGDGELRAYIPTDGNAFDKQTKCAYGNDDKPLNYEEIEKEVNGDLMIADILNRITLKP